MKFMLMETKIVVYLENVDQFITFPQAHKKFNEVYDFLVSHPQDENGFIELFVSIATEALEKYSQGAIKVTEGVASLDGIKLPTDVLAKIKELQADGYDWTEHKEFWVRCLLNPEERSVTDLFRFISKHKLTITEEGKFLAYKAVRSTFFDKHSNTFDNSPGNTVTMSRDRVEFNPNVSCSTGLHVSNLNYAQGFAGPGDKIVIVEVDPVDVVSVPYDCDAEKIRTCGYKVLAVWEDQELPTSVVSIDDNKNILTKKDKKIKDRINSRNDKYNWTPVEIQLLKKATRNYTSDSFFDWEAVANILGSRTAAACRRKYNRLVEEGAVASKDNTSKSFKVNHTTWDKKEVKKLIKLYFKGLSYAELSNKLYRSESSIASKIFHLRQQGKLG